ncbi:MAG: beta-mannosidase [Natrialbaceae archaeon]|jgi:beta-mannosidase
MPVEWTAGTVDPSARGPPDPDEWSAVKVPGRPERFAGAEAVAYRTTFPDPRSTAEQRAILELSGAYAHVEVWLNGERLGTHDAYFVPARFEFDPEPENQLQVVCRSPTDRFGGVHATDRVPDEMAVPGIWWNVAIRIRPPTYIADLTVGPRLTDDSGEIDVAVTVDSRQGIDDRVTLSLRPEGFRGGGTMDRVGVQVPAGERVTATRTIDVREPTFWWPASLGDQHRYTVRAKLGDHETTATTGFCDVARDGDTLRVNDEPVSLRGFGVLPTGNPVADVEAARAANANLLRAYGHVPPREFHQAATESGVLVWQDLPLVGQGSFDVERAKALATALAGEYGHHPSVATYGVHTDPVDPFSDPLGEGRLARLRVRWRVWRTNYNREPAEQVADEFPSRALVLPVTGKPGTNPDATSLFPGWDFGRASDIEWLLDRYPPLDGPVGEFGAAALAGDVADRPDHFDWQVHDARVQSTDPEASQAYQTTLLKTVVETLRRRETPLQTPYCLRDSFAVGGMGVLTVDGDRKRAFEAVADSFEPIQAILDGSPEEAEGIVVCNGSRVPVEGTLSWSMRPADRSGKGGVSGPGSNGSAEVSVPAGGTTRVGEMDFGNTGTIYLEFEIGDASVSNTYDL